MTDRTITARLRVAYENSGLNKFSKDLRGVASEGKKTSQAVGRDWSELGRKTASIGSSMTTKLTLPLVGLGGAAAKMSADFSAQFDQMVALAGVASSEIDGLKASVLALSEETGRGPAELADALYFIRGAGLSGKTALDALEVSAKAAASGLGTTVEVANALTNVINAYGAANISAAEAGDILTAAVTSAKVEASEMAPQFGRLLPVAAELGVEFGDVAGVLAFLTTSSGDAAQASTGLGGVLRKLLQPSQQGAKALEQIGLKASDLRAMLGRDGLDGTVAKLREQLGDVGFKQLFDDSEALAAALQMTGDNAELLDTVMGDVEDSTGALDDAFKRTDNDSRKAAIAMAKGEAALIRFGDAIMPVVTVLLDLASAAAGALGHMPEELRTAVVLFGALLAASGPLLQIFGGVTTKLAELSKWLETSSLGTGRFGSQMEKLPAIARGTALALGAIGVALAGIEVIAGQRESKVRGWIEDKIGDPGTLSEVRSSIADVKRELDELDNREGKGRLFSVGGANIFATGGDADRQERIDQLREKLGELEAQEESLVGQEAETAAAYVGTDAALAGLNEETSNAVNQLQEYVDTLQAQFDPLFAMTDALVGNEEAQRKVTEARAALDEAMASGTEEEVAAAQRDLDAAYQEATRSALDYEVAASQLQAGIEAGTVSVADAKAQLGRWVEQGLISAETARVMGVRFDNAATKADSVAGNRNASFTTSGLTTAQQKVANFKAQIDALPWSKTVTLGVKVAGAVGQMLALQSIANRATGGPVDAGRLYRVAEHGRAELLRMGGETFLIPGTNGYVDPALSGHMTSGAEYGGGGMVLNVTVDMRGAVVSSSRQFKRMVSEAFTEEARKGRALASTVKALAG